MAILRRLLRKWWLILLCVGLGYFGAKAYLRYQDISYEIQALIQITEDEQSGVNTRVVLGDMGVDPRQNLETDIMMMKSRGVLSKVVDDLNLAVSYYAEGRIRNSNLYGSSNVPVRLVSSAPSDDVEGKLMTLEVLDSIYMAFGYEEDLDTFRIGLPFTSKYGKFNFEHNDRSGRTFSRVLVSFYDPQALADRYAERLSVRARPNSNFLQMQIEDEVPQRGMDIINAVIETYDSIMISRKNDSSYKTLSFIDERIDEYRDELNSVEQRAEDFIRENDLLVDIPTNLQKQLGELREAEQQLALLKLQLKGIDNLAGYLQNGEDPYRQIPYSADIPSVNISGFIQQYNELLQQREIFLATASQENPVVQAVEEPLSGLKNDILDAVGTARQSIQNDVNRLNNSADSLLNEVRSVPGQRRELLSIDREQGIKEQLYLFLLQRREETSLTTAITASGIHLVEPPSNEGPVGPDPLQVYAIGLVLGFFLPASAIAAREILDNTIKSQTDISDYLDVPILGSIGASEDEQHIVVKHGSRTAVAEMFRLVRTNLRFVGAQQQKQVILVTSSMGGEGKTFICINLGASLAISGTRVLLVGMDLRKPKLGAYASGLNSSDTELPGVTNYLTGFAKLEETIHPVEGHENLYYQPCGTIPPNPGELMMGPQTVTMFQELRKQFDYIVVDTAPVGLVSDALQLRSLVDLSLYIVRYGVTDRKQLMLAADIYQHAKLPNLTVVVNGVKRGADYGYGYGYGYGDGDGYYVQES